MKKKQTTTPATFSCWHFTKASLTFLLLMLSFQTAGAQQNLAAQQLTISPTTVNVQPAGELTVPADSHSAAELNAIAWRFYNNGRYSQAESFFRQALNAGKADNKTALSVQLGLGYTELKQGKYAEARKHFSKALRYTEKGDNAGREKAVEGQFLATWQAGSFKEAWALLAQNRHSPWAARYLKAEIEIPLCVKSGDQEGGLELLKKYEADMSREKDRKKRHIFQSLLLFLNVKKVCSPMLCDSILREGLPEKEAMTCINRLKNRMPRQYTELLHRARRTHPAWFRKKIKKSPQSTDAKRAAMAFAEKNYRDAARFSVDALEKDQKNISLVSLAAWSYFHLEEWEQAAGWFSKGLNMEKSPDMLRGLSWSLIRQGKCGECAALLEKETMEPGSELLDPLLQALNCAGHGEYRKNEWDEAADYFKKYIKLSPVPDPGVQELLAWSYYRAEKWNDAERAFAKLLATDYREDWFNARGRSLVMQGEYGAVTDLYESYNENGDYPGSLKNFLSASGLEEQSMCRAAGCENYLAAGPAYRHRSGDKGEGRLNDWSLPVLYARYRVTDNVVMRAQGAYRHVSNGNDSDDFATSYLSARWQPVATLYFDAGAGFTGSGAQTGTRAVWHVGVNRHTSAGDVRLTAYRSTVDDSLLSIAGMEDDEYGDWGGVSRTGGLISWSHDIGEFNINSLFDFERRTGKSVKSNNRYLANFSAGKTVSTGSLGDYIQKPWVGIYATWFGYERNLNYYTYGNGGYFSPKSFIAAGPVMNIRTIEGKRWLAAINTSVGYVNYSEDDGWQYPKNSGKERGWQYNGESRDLLGFGFQARTAWEISRHLAVEAKAGFDKSADFNQWHGGINLVFYPDDISGLFFDGLPQTVPSLP